MQTDKSTLGLSLFSFTDFILKFIIKLLSHFNEF